MLDIYFFLKFNFFWLLIKYAKRERERIAGLIERVRTELERTFLKTNKIYINFIVVTVDRFINDL